MIIHNNENYPSGSNTQRRNRGAINWFEEYAPAIDQPPALGIDSRKITSTSTLQSSNRELEVATIGKVTCLSLLFGA